MGEEGRSIEVAKELARLGAEYGNLNRRYYDLASAVSNLSEDARKASQALVVAQSNSLCLDDAKKDRERIRSEIREELERTRKEARHHNDAVQDILHYQKALVDMAKQDEAFRRVRNTILRAATWITGVGSAVVLAYQLVENGGNVFKAIADAIDKAFK